MNLREAFRYQSFLDNLATQATRYLTKDNVTRTRETRFLSKVKPDMADETVDVTPERSMPYTVDQIVGFVRDLIERRRSLCYAVEATKNDLRRDRGISVDALASVNKMRRDLCSALNRLSVIKSSETNTQGTGYTFNANGDQTSYRYDAKRVTTIDFDRDKVKRWCQSEFKKADEASTTIEVAQVTAEVDFVPPYDVNGTLEDAIEVYLKNAI